MKTLGILLLGVLATLAFPACNTTEKYAQNNAAGMRWLNINAGTPKINITGRWHSAVWGGALLSQNGNRITGTIGDYQANGVVRGDIACIALSSEGWVYYTIMARLTAPDSLVGYYSSEVPYSPSDESAFALTRSVL